MKHLFSLQILCFLFFCCSSSLTLGQAPSGIWNWAKLEGSANQERAVDITADSLGNLYVIGYFDNSFQWGNVTLVSSGSFDFFLAKLDPLGNPQWIVTEGGSSVDIAHSITLHPNGQVYIAGFFQGTAQIGTQSLSSTGGSDAFVAVYDTAGNFVQAFSGGGSGDDSFYNIEISPDSNLIMGGFFTEGSSGASFDTLTINDNPGNTVRFPIVTKYSPQGNIIWAEYGVSAGAGQIRSVTCDSAGNIYATGGYGTKLVWDTDSIVPPWNTGTFISKISNDGQLEWLSGGGGPNGSFGFDVVINPQNQPQLIASLVHGYGTFDGVQIGSQGVNNAPELLLLTYDSTGTLIDHLLFGSEHAYPSRMEYDEAGNLYICGSFGWDFLLNNQVILTNLDSEDGFILKLDPTDSLLMINATFGVLAHEILGFVSRPDGNIYIAGYSETTTVFGDSLSSNFLKVTNNGDYDIMLAAISDTTVPPQGSNIIRGRVFLDGNQNCSIDPEDLALKNRLVRADPGPHWGVTDNSGYYEIQTGPGNFQVRQQLGPYLDQFITPLCPTNPPYHMASFSGFMDTTMSLDFANQADTCYAIEVDVASTSRRLCFQNLTTILYRNLGFGHAPNAIIHLKLPAHVILLQSDSTYQQLPDSTYVFPLGDLPPGFQGHISIIDSVVCGNPVDLIGLAQCTEVWATPVGTCIEPDSAWSGADLAVSATCHYGVGSFHIVNQGSGDMNDSVAYRVYKNTLLLFQDKLKLNAGDSLSFQLAAHGAFLRVEVDQVPLHPTSTQESVDLQGCYIPTGPSDPSAPPPSSMALLNTQNDREPERRIDCMIITGSYDPNDKLATPIGRTLLHIVPTHTPIHYRIRFQNTGNDTAFKVVLVDSLSPFLDPASLVFGASSHPVQYSVSGQGSAVLTFTFDNILLPDSTTDPLGSQGFVSFTVSPFSSNPEPTIVYNSADIYFDFNPPIHTNTVFHTFWDTTFSQIDPTQVEFCTGNPSQAIAGVDSSFCELDSVHLWATKPTHGIGTWQFVSGTGSLTDVALPQTLIRSLDYGLTELSWVVQLCEQSSRDSLTLYRFAQPDIPVISLSGTDSLHASETGTSYEWYLNGVLLSDSSQTIVASQQGEYQVRVINGPCESALSGSYLFQLMGNSEFSQTRFEIYPNPSSGLFQIQTFSPIQAEQAWRVYDSKGILCTTRQVLITSEAQRIEWDLSFLPNGIYLIQIGEWGSQKLVIQH
ncbi:MAG: T9SS type A sorting domain-containing protein [Bacteroidota bacterium]